MRAIALVQAPRDTRFAPDAIKVKSGQPVTFEDREVGTVLDVGIVLDGTALEVTLELNGAGARLLSYLPPGSITFPEEDIHAPHD